MQVFKRPRQPLSIHPAAEFKITVGERIKSRLDIRIIDDDLSSDVDEWICVSGNERFFGTAIEKPKLVVEDRPVTTIGLHKELTEPVPIPGAWRVGLLREKISGVIEVETAKLPGSFYSPPKRRLTVASASGDSDSVPETRGGSISSIDVDRGADYIPPPCQTTSHWESMVRKTPMPLRLIPIGSANLRRKLLSKNRSKVPNKKDDSVEDPTISQSTTSLETRLETKSLNKSEEGTEVSAEPTKQLQQLAKKNLSKNETAIEPRTRMVYNVFEKAEQQDATGIVVAKDFDYVYAHCNGIDEELFFPPRHCPGIKIGDWIHVEMTVFERTCKDLKVNIIKPLHLSIPMSAGVLVACQVNVPFKEEYAMSTRITSDISDNVFDLDHCIPLNYCGQTIDAVVQYKYKEGEPRGFWLIVRIF